jgi:hypothetical protein
MHRDAGCMLGHLDGCASGDIPFFFSLLGRFDVTVPRIARVASARTERIALLGFLFAASQAFFSLFFFSSFEAGEPPGT